MDLFFKNKLDDIFNKNNIELFIKKEISNNLNNYTDLILKFYNIELDVKYLTPDLYNLAISNHISELDFLILFKILDKKYKYIANNRIKLLENIPILNLWTKNELIYVKRDSNIGVEDIKRDVNPNDNILIFPEGTLLYKSTFDFRNNECIKKNIIPYNNVLLPKKNGFDTLTQILKPEYITNITFKYILYDNIIIQNLDNPITIMNYFNLKLIKKIIVVVDKIKFENNTDINDIFREKDKLIDQLN